MILTQAIDAEIDSLAIQPDVSILDRAFEPRIRAPARFVPTPAAASSCRGSDAGPGWIDSVLDPEPSLDSRVGIRRQFAAIVASDVAGYSRLIELDDLGTVLRLRALRRLLIEPAAVTYHASFMRYVGDAFLMAFPEPVDAVQCAVSVQRGLSMLEGEMPEDRRIRLRIGVNIDVVLLVDGDLHGSGVNVAARLETLAEPGDVYISEAVFHHTRNVLPLAYEALGQRKLKNIAEPVSIYRIARDEITQALPMAG
jgi:class 3 adenylate cyclase